MAACYHCAHALGYMPWKASVAVGEESHRKMMCATVGMEGLLTEWGGGGYDRLLEGSWVVDICRNYLPHDCQCHLVISCRLMGGIKRLYTIHVHPNSTLGVNIQNGTLNMWLNVDGPGHL